MANDFKAMVEAWPGCDSRLVLRATFNDECMHCDAAELMLREMSLIISNILEQPDESFLGNCFMSDSSLRSCIDLAESQDLAPHTLMHSQFEAHPKSNPDDYALVFGGNLLDEDSPKSPALYVAILGTLNAGGAWCPVDVFSPAQRCHELIIRTEGQLVLVSSIDNIPMGEALPSGIIPIDVFPFTRESERDMNARASDAPITDPTNVAYIIWTSGTTGPPKASFAESSRLRSLGIDSISAIRLVSRLNEAGYSLPVVDVLQCETVRDLVLVASSWSKASQARNLLDLEQFNREWQREVSALIPGSFFVCPTRAIQQSFLGETLTTSEMYWSHHSFSLHSDVDIDKLKQAWATVCRRNEALRTCFIPVAALQKQIHGCENDSGILQVMLEQHEVDWEYIECKSKSYQQNLHRRIVALQDRHQSSYFQNPPWAITIMDDFQERTMIFSIHHVLYDGTSLGYIMNDVCCAYGADAPNRPQLRNALSLLLPSKKASLDAQEFWEQELSDYANFDVPSWPDLTGERTSPERGNIRRFITETVPLSVPTAQLEAKTAELGVSSVASVVRAAFGHVLLSYLGSSGVVFAETVSDRVLDVDVDRTIGPFISVVPMPMSSNGTVREVLAEQHRLSTKAKKHRHIHAQVIRKLLKKERGESL
ncbi:uncharacterized protein FRV6_16463 [Fusarium oxysporum]|uniref:Carrier domain-containing protein n=1 Tax=Fusarium oxysporum TaxID=5507 RepID=A0A2H3TXH1_FUSOX|nr:uncharacterized protein FRV6_16463 [Fusarium oxysporum]